MWSARKFVELRQVIEDLVDFYMPPKTYADQWEVGLEKYLDNGGLLAASYFHKKIDGVVVNALTGVVEDVAVYNANGTLNGYYDFDVYQPVNAKGAYEVDGIAYPIFDASIT